MLREPVLMESLVLTKMMLPSGWTWKYPSKVVPMSGEMRSGVGRMRESPVSGRLAKIADPSRATSRSDVASKSSHSPYPAAAAMSGTMTDA